MKSGAVFLRGWLIPAVLAAATLVAAACGGGDGDDSEQGAAPTATAAANPEAPALTALPAVDDLSVGANRFAFILLDAENLSVNDAAVLVRFYYVEESGPELVFEAQSERHSVENWFPHLHEDGGTHLHVDTTSYYAVPEAIFDREGNWGAEFVVSRPAEGETLVRAGFRVSQSSSTPALGQIVPATDNPTIDDVADISEIDTSDPPRPELHTISVADALKEGKPFVVTFSSPTFCRSRLCGPVTDIVASLYPVYGDRVNFIHIEPYDLDLLHNEARFVLTSPSEEWGLPSEPWTFVVDASGRLVAKLEGLLSVEELEATLAPLIGS